MRYWRSLALACVIAVIPGLVRPAAAANEYGKLTGLVFDSTHVPQMGATVALTPEASDGRSVVQLLTDQNGVFHSDRIGAGLYSVKVTLNGFLPAIERHIAVTANLDTMLRIELDSVFLSLDQLRRVPTQQTETDDWKWVLRTSSATRPVLQFSNASVQQASVNDSDLNPETRPQAPRARIEMTNGSVHPGSSSALPGAMATAASYDQRIGAAGKLMISAQAIYSQIPGPGSALGAAVAGIWIPSGEFGNGPETMLVVRQVALPMGQAIRVGRFEHSEQMALSDNLTLDYGAEYLMGGLAGAAMTSAVRPHMHAVLRVSPNWSAAFSLETDPDLAGLKARGADLVSAMDALDTLPVLMYHNGRSLLAGGWHEEGSVRRTLGSRASVEASAFHDYSGDQAVFEFGRSSSSGLPFTRLGAADAGSGGSWGTRVTYREKLSDYIEVAGIYAWAGALTPGVAPNTADLNELLPMRYRQSAAARISGSVPRLGTRFSASYKWIDGPVASRQDLFGEEALGIDPNVSLTVRQPLPCFHAPCHWEVTADVRNLFSQGYVTVYGLDGSRALFEPVERSFRGGLSFQF